MAIKVYYQQYGKISFSLSVLMVFILTLGINISTTREWLLNLGVSNGHL